MSARIVRESALARPFADFGYRIWRHQNRPTSDRRKKIATIVLSF
jgi:hypothetical protein